MNVTKGLTYVKEGASISVLQRKWRKYRARQQMTWWKSQGKRRTHVEVEVQPGIRMNLYFDSRLSGLIYFGKFEQAELSFLMRILRQGEIFLDVGANIGLYTLVAASKVGVTGHVYSFEPTSTTYQRLENNIKLNSFTNISPYKLAVSDIESETDLNVSLDGFDAWNSLEKPLAGSSFATERVVCLTLDQFVDRHDLKGRIAMIKVDVEGWEAQVISGASQTLSGIDAPILQLEFNQSSKQSTNPLNIKVSELVQGLGYQLFTFEGKSGRLTLCDVHSIRQQTNVIAAKNLDELYSRLRAN